MTKTPKKPEKTKVKNKVAKVADTKKPPEKKEEFGGRGGPDPTRYGDWEIGGKCVDF
jgi:hypothetical protein